MESPMVVRKGGLSVDCSASRSVVLSVGRLVGSKADLLALLSVGLKDDLSVVTTVFRSVGLKEENSAEPMAESLVDLSGKMTAD